jgi:hypothetical protein
VQGDRAVGGKTIWLAPRSRHAAASNSDTAEENVKMDIQPKTADIPPFSERPSSAEENTRVVRFEILPATR